MYIYMFHHIEQLPKLNIFRGGVYPPGAAFSKTSLIDQLNKNGLSFEVISENIIN